MFVNEICQLIIRPPKSTYSTRLLGPELSIIQGVPVTREDFEFTSRQLKLQASYFITQQIHHRCLIYLHGNSSCRFEGMQQLERILSIGVNLCVFDFAGCGLSEGQYVTMGFYEKEDVKELMNYIEWRFGKVDEFILWGRSMGAVTALMLSQEPRITTYIADSAFTNLITVIEGLAKQFLGYFSFLFQASISQIRKKIIDEAQFDINHVSPINHVSIQSYSKRFYFIHGINDNLIDSGHSQRLYERCKSYKILEFCDGGHNSKRNKDILDNITQFINLSRFDLQLNVDYTKKCSKYFKVSQSFLNNYKIEQLEQTEKIKNYLKQKEIKKLQQQQQQQQLTNFQNLERRYFQ